MKKTQKQWAIFYRINGELYATATTLGLAILSDKCVNVYCDKDKLDELFAQTLSFTRRSKAVTSGHGQYEVILAPKYRNGRLFISRVGSKDFPVKLLENPKFQGDGELEKKVWALRVPCRFIGK